MTISCMIHVSCDAEEYFSKAYSSNIIGRACAYFKTHISTLSERASRETSAPIGNVL